MIAALKKYPLLYALILPGMLYFIVFWYVPMFGLVVAFKDYSPMQGLSGIFTSEWVGFQYFRDFFNSYSFLPVMGNTVTLGFYTLVSGFVAPIIFAILLNEVLHKRFKKIVQSISYLPHFLSWVVVVGIVNFMLSPDGGIVNELLRYLGGDSVNFMGEERYYRTILVVTQVWQSIGWESIFILAAISAIDTEQYEAAIIDGASKWRQIWHVTLPGVLPILSILLILKMGSVLNLNYELILLTYSPMTIDKADVIDTFVYREGLVGMKFSYSTAVGLFKSVLSVALILGTNALAKRFGQSGIW